MVIDSINKKRLAIFSFYDKDGIVDGYIPYLLEDLCQHVDEIFIICNSKLTPQGRNTFLKFTRQILVHSDKRLHVGAYREALEQIGWSKLGEFDEVILFDSTIMGPIYPFTETFSKMDQKDVDFWSITKCFGVFDDAFYGYISSHFIAVRRDILNNVKFREYWENVPPTQQYQESICLSGMKFTQYFSDLGFTWDVSIDIDDLKEFAFDPLQICPKELIKNRRCPIFEKTVFSHNYFDFLQFTTGQPAYELMEYITHHTSYDENFIWDNILRTVNQADFKKAMQLNYILPSDQAKPLPKDKKIALVMHLYYMDLLDDSYHYASAMPAGSDIYITTTDLEKKSKIEKHFQSLKDHQVKTIVIPNRGRDVSALLIGAKDFVMDYDYVCFVHDKKSNMHKPYSIGKGFSDRCFENLLENKNFVSQVIDTFEKNPRLGMLMPPPPNHAGYYPTSGLEWGVNNFENTVNLLNKLKITVPIDSKKEPIAPLGTMFWFRPQTLQPLFSHNFCYEDFPKEPIINTDGMFLHWIERVYGFVVQSEGYYPGWIMSDRSFSIELTNLYFMLREIGVSLSDYFPAMVFDQTCNALKEKLTTTEHPLNDKQILKKAMKNRLPRPLFQFVLKVKRLFFGPHGKIEE